MLNPRNCQLSWMRKRNLTVICFVFKLLFQECQMGGRHMGYQAECTNVRRTPGPGCRYQSMMSNEAANDYDKLKKTLLTSYSFTEDGYVQTEIQGCQVRD